MKKYLLGLMTIVMMAVVCVGFTACGSDDDDEGGGSSGKNGAVIDGQSMDTSYGYWYYLTRDFYSTRDKRWYLDFSNVDMRNVNAGNFPKSGINVVCIDFEGDEASEVPTGEFDDFNVYVVKGMTPTSEGEQIEKYYEKEGKLVITKSGNKYTISYTGVTLSDDKHTVANTSFSYTGSLIHYEIK